MCAKVIDGNQFNRRVETPEGSTIIINKSKGDCIEINEYIIAQGRSVYFNPPASIDAMKSYYIVSGLIETTDECRTCGEGTLILLKCSDEVFHVSALKETRVLVHSLNDNSFEDTEVRFRYAYNLLQEIQNKDAYTLIHSESVKSLVEKVAKRLGYSGNRYRSLVSAGCYHDIGKIYIPVEVLNKPSQLNFEEYETMKQHVTMGKDLLVQFFGEEMYAMSTQHHERLDGSGYPLGLKGDEISVEGRILAICDSYDAMRSERVYKKAKTKEEAIIELRNLKDTKYDAKLVEIFIDIINGEE